MTVVKVRPQQTALFLCDIQEKFRSAIFEFGHVISTSRKLVKAAEILQYPVFATEQNPSKLGATVHELGFDKLPAKLNPLNGARPKTLFSMLIPEVLQALHQQNIRSVLLVGIESHVCVLQTCLDLLANGFEPHVIADGISSCNAQEIPIAIERMRQAGASVTTSESILFQLMADSNHPSFKTFSGLIKDEKAATQASLAKLPPLTPHL